jgi:aspartyl-tRNA(Asn)/glutamyl-tRNA(Gln) amidotransferase subunit A
VFYDPTPRVEIAARQMRGAGMRRFVTFTAPANLTGYPSLSVPAGLDRSGTPFGYQLIARPLGEHALFTAGYAIERDSRWPLPPAPQ